MVFRSLTVLAISDSSGVPFLMKNKSLSYLSRSVMKMWRSTSEEPFDVYAAA
jgi:hypothetical protein